MRVLMFGWEFPPHISGGLGTACFGLTQSLARENTQVLFVMPKADAQTAGERINIINASNIFFRPRKQKDLVRASPAGKTEVLGNKRTEDADNILILPISANLSPYTALDPSLGLSRWNYPWQDVEQVAPPWQAAPPLHVAPRWDVKEKIRYQFSGGYGPRLLEEVERYADVAAEVARQNTFDVIHAHDWLTYPAGVMAKKISGKPLVVHVHATEYDRAGENIDARVYEVERKGMEESDRVIAVSQWTKDIILRHYQIPEGKVEVVHNGIAFKEKHALFSALPIDKQIVTFLGRITYQKGPQFFIEAARKVLREFPDVHFVMAGSGDLLPKMIERVAELKMSPHFHFTGFLKGEQVDRIWSASNVYVMPSVSEPFGIAPLEAIQAGVPVIISRQSGVSEVIKHVIKVDFWDTEALADAICNMLKYKSLTKTLQKKSKEELQEITWKRAAKKINKLYDEITTQNALPEPLFSGAPAKAVRSVQFF
jgi:glycogen(starch) synthase